jgi:hypothetical protein
MALKSKAKPRTTAIEKHTAALRDHTREMKRHAKTLETYASAHHSLSKALSANTAALVFAAKAAPEDPIRKSIRHRIETATGNSPDSLAEDDKVSGMLAGGPGAMIALVADINNEFWPNGNVRLKVTQVKDLTIGQLITLILSKLP